ncbi:Glycosyltransferase involved in cell wall bisynthesis [Alkalibacterium subtropicum]|uniref:Glycosyltransferase involved in cell wall bisynthesis n=1 Tax=Alkalibacterium subtropicum TaxID=753702 RepID=A0A1I1GE82_9LACT|nr:glycosyltransferase family 2 protein [Alkalibacterium subtropicum]SFC09765.1 Glycosyltransferase involved in cell wall bisynthesis [Alkalibacterium subtropicum]
MPFFSIVMAVYNVEKYVEKAVLSVLTQTFDDFELIIVNDGTPDDAMLIVEKLAREDDRIKIFNQRNKGLSAARNRGLKAARGEYVCFIDSDDEVDENLLKTTKMVIRQTYPDVLMYGMYFEKVGISEQVVKTDEITMSERDFRDREFKTFTLDDTSIDLIGYCTNKMYKRKLLNAQTILFDESIMFLEDIAFNEKVFKAADTLKVISDSFYHYKMRNRKSLITTFQDRHFEWQLDAVRSRKEIFEKWEIDQERIDGIVAGLHVLAIRRTCSLLFKHSNDLTFKEKCDYIYSMLHHPLTNYRISHYPALSILDRVLKWVVEKRGVYTLAVISSIYALPSKYFK